MSGFLTMADVAKAAGVHQTTVSRALRDHPSIPERLRGRIRAIGNKMGYRPNPLVSALISQRKRGRRSVFGSRLGFLTVGSTRDDWRLGSPNYARLFDLIQRRAEALGYGVEEFWLEEPGLSKERLRRVLLNRGIRGVVVSPLPEGRQSLDFDFSEFAAVALRFSLKVPALDHVSIDYSASMNLAIERLQGLGHRRLAFATTTGIDRRVGHLSLGAYLSERELRPGYFLKPAIEARWDKRKFLGWMTARRPDALITPIVGLFAKFKIWLEEEGWKLPADLSLVTVDCHLDSEEAGVLQNLEEEARAVVDLLTSRVERAQFGVPLFPRTVLVSGIWRDGNSLKDRRPQISSDMKGGGKDASFRG